MRNILIPLSGRSIPVGESELASIDVREIRVPIPVSVSFAHEFSDMIPPYLPCRIFTLEATVGADRLFMERLQ